MRGSTPQHPLDCGRALHARTMDLCLLAQAGETLVHRPRTATPEARPQAIAPSRAQSGLAAAGLWTWSGLAALWADQGLPGVLGQARSMQASQGGTAHHAPSDAPTIAVRLRGALLPQASGAPAARRATRALRRRRRPLARTRGARLAPGHTTHRPSPLPARGPHRAATTHRDGVAERGAAPAGRQRLAVELARITSDAALRRDLARPSVQTAPHPDAQTLALRHPGPGLGPRPAGAGWRRLWPPGPVRHGLGGDPLCHLRHPQRPGASHGGVLRSGCLLPPGASGRATRPCELGAPPEARPGLDQRRPSLGARW
jgi:hypothetical protein